MDNNKIIIILLIIIAALLTSAFVMFYNQGEDTSLTIEDKKLKSGESVKVILSDKNNNSLANKTITVTLTDKNKTQIIKNITTNSKGVAKFKIKDSGKYLTECKFTGDKAYKSSNTSDNITVKKDVSKVSKNVVSLVPEFDKYTRKNVGEYTVEVTKWRGETVGGFGVYLYKNGELVDKNSYQSRAYFNMDGEWKWSYWDNGDQEATYHKYGVSSDVEIAEVEVMF